MRKPLRLRHGLKDYLRLLSLASTLALVLSAAISPLPAVASPSLSNAQSGSMGASRAQAPLAPQAPRTAQTASNTIVIDTSGWSGMSQSSDTQNGWGDDQWQFSLNTVMSVTVSIQDCCIVGDNYTIYIDKKAIGTTPPESYQGSTFSSGSFSALVGPGTHFITIQDVGAPIYYQQGDTTMFPAGYSVQIQMQPATINQPTIFVHGVGENASKLGTSDFGPIYTAIQTLTGQRPDTYTYVDDRAGPPSCINSPCDSQSGILPNAIWLAKDVVAKYAATHHKVALIGYSMGAAIIRTMLAGCPAMNASVCTQATGDINDVFFIEGVQQGSYLIGVINGTDSWLLTSGGAVIGTMLSVGLDTVSQSIASSLQLSIYGAAEQDLSPESDNVLLHDATEPPTGLRYFNFYGDIHLRVQPSLWGLQPLLPAPTGPSVGVSVGDVAILPGNDNPTSHPANGGSMFCLQCVAHSGYSSSQINATTSYTEWALSDTVDVSSLSVASCIPRLQALVGGVCLKELASIPMFHTNIAQAASLSGSGAIQVRDATGISQTATIPEEIVRQIEVGDGVIP